MCEGSNFSTSLLILAVFLYFIMPIQFTRCEVVSHCEQALYYNTFNFRQQQQNLSALKLFFLCIVSPLGLHLDKYLIQTHEYLGIRKLNSKQTFKQHLLCIQWDVSNLYKINTFILIFRFFIIL